MYRQSGPARLSEHGEAAGAHAGTTCATKAVQPIGNRWSESMCATRRIAWRRPAGRIGRTESCRRSNGDRPTTHKTRRSDAVVEGTDSRSSTAAPPPLRKRHYLKQKPKTATDKEKRRKNERKPNKRTRPRTQADGRSRTGQARGPPAEGRGNYSNSNSNDETDTTQPGAGDTEHGKRGACRRQRRGRRPKQRNAQHSTAHSTQHRGAQLSEHEETMRQVKQTKRAR